MPHMPILKNTAGAARHMPQGAMARRRRATPVRRRCKWRFEGCQPTGGVQGNAVRAACLQTPSVVFRRSNGCWAQIRRGRCKKSDVETGGLLRFWWSTSCIGADVKGSGSDLDGNFLSGFPCEADFTRGSQNVCPNVCKADLVLARW